MNGACHRLAWRLTRAVIALNLAVFLLPACRSTPRPPSPSPSAPEPFDALTWEDGLRPEFASDLDALPAATRYDVELTVHPTATRVTGHQRVRYVNGEEVPLEDLALRLFPNTPGYGGAMQVTALELNGRPVEPAVELGGSALRLALDPPLEPGQAMTLAAGFVITVPTTLDAGYGQLAYTNGVMALPNAYALVPVYDDAGWNVEVAREYGDAVTSDVAFYEVQVSAPAGLTLRASGSCASAEPGTWSCVGAPMRDFVLVLGDDYATASRAVGGVAIHSTYYGDHEESGRWVLQVAADAVRTFTDLLGPYPYAELDVVETPTLAGGIEYPGLVVVGESLYEGNSRLEWVVVHEVAHQWLYGLVGNDQVDEPWLDEALVQYCTLLHYERVYGADAAAEVLDWNFRQAQRDLIESGDDMPVGLPVASYPRYLYSAVVYRKGPLYFQALREQVGDETFFAILRTYFVRHRYGIATAEDWLTAVRIVAGDDHRTLYDQWIVGTTGQ
jgi:hypothetical protein